ncbi:adenine deaminase C-terminal domain-containing protein [Halorientalis marina]|uniref:adenine deaminase C-terminal domain-containing protein n=1 Tax=Halorientalis marina TaxID=2931976 RepID=UPI001FF54CDB|nr:adenine deaminase C-terminal domain-containing protein [Halorientalis marina]
MPEPVDLLVRGTLVDVNTARLEDRAIAVDDGEIVALEERPAERELDAEYVTPGLIDAHTHVEAAMVTIPQYGDAVVPHGVTSVVHDPHEIANVTGAEGVRNFDADAAETPLKARMTVPSSVPASPLQDAGATVDADAVAALLDAERAIALGEVMDLPAVLDGDAGMHAKIRAARERDLTVDGHVPGITGSDLQELARYLDTDHESVTRAEARAKADAGFHVHLREGSTSKNLDALVGIVDEVDTRRLSLCTDDRSVVDILDRGGINEAVVKAIDLGVDPVEAVQMATINTAEAYDLPFGRVEPGAPADMVLLDDLESWDVAHVVVDGVVDPTDGTEPPVGSAVATDTVTFDPVDPADLAISHDGPGPVDVRVESAVGSFRTESMTAEVPVETDDPAAETDAAGVLTANREADVLPMAVIERHGGPGTIGCGFVHNLGLDRGAIGTTIAHDAHNCVVAGVTHDAMAAVANELREVGGGLAVSDPAADTLTTLPLPVAGMLSEAPAAETARRFEAVRDAADDIGLTVPGGVLELSYLALEVIPEVRLTNNGLVDVTAGEYVDVVVE